MRAPSAAGQDPTQMTCSSTNISHRFLIDCSTYTLSYTAISLLLHPTLHSSSEHTQRRPWSQPDSSDSAFKTSTAARSIASSILPSCPIDPSDGGTSIERKICFLKRRAGSPGIADHCNMCQWAVT